MAKRGRPPKNKKVDIDKKDIEKKEEETQEEEIGRDEPIDDEQVEETSQKDTQHQTSPQPTPIDSDLVGKGTHTDYNPFDENVVEREYSTPKVASGLVEDIEEPQFIPPSYEDIMNEDSMETGEVEGEMSGSPFDNPNPALNELDNKDKKIACESLVDTFLDGYEQLHKYAQYVVKVDEDELLQRHQSGKLDLNERIPVDENGNEMSVSEFVSQYNQQSVEALQYDQEFGYKVRPAMVRVFMKKGWGMSDEQFLMYHFGKDIAIKAGMMFQLKKTINSTLETLEKAHKRNKRDGFVNEAPPVFNDNADDIEEDYDEDYEETDTIDIENKDIIDEPLKPLTPEEDFEDKSKDYSQNLSINMPDKRGATQLPKEVRDEIQKPKPKSKKGKRNG